MADLENNTIRQGRPLTIPALTGLSTTTGTLGMTWSANAGPVVRTAAVVPLNDADHYFSSLIAVNPRNTFALLMRGVVRSEIDDLDKAFADLDKAHTDERLLDNEFERLKSDKQSQATPLRVERTARDKLAMRTATPAVTAYIGRTTAPASAAAAGSPGGVP